MISDNMPRTSEELKKYVGRIVARAKRDGVAIGVIMASAGDIVGVETSPYWCLSHPEVAEGAATVTFDCLGPDDDRLIDTLKAGAANSFNNAKMMANNAKDYIMRQALEQTDAAFTRELNRRDNSKPRPGAPGARV